MEFDSYARSYEMLHNKNLAPLGAESAEFLADKLAWCALFATKRFESPNRTKTFLDYGCGTGRVGQEFYRYFDKSWNYVGVDPSSACINAAEQDYFAKSRELFKVPLFLTLESWNQNMAPCDLILAACVFHHISPDQRPFILGQLWKVLKPKGAIIIWEHNPWNPITRRVVKDCPFDRDACLFSASEMNRLWQKTISTGRTGFRFVTFFPGILRKLKPTERVLGWLPLGGQWVFWGMKN